MCGEEAGVEEWEWEGNVGGRARRWGVETRENA